LLAGQTVLVNGNKTLRSTDHCAFHVSLLHPQQMSVAPDGTLQSYSASRSNINVSQLIGAQ